MKDYKIALFMLSVLAVSGSPSFAAEEADFDQQSVRYTPQGQPDPVIQAGVDQYQMWAKNKYFSIPQSYIKDSDIIEIPTADTTKFFHGSTAHLTQDTMNQAATFAAADMGYSDPLDLIKAIRIPVGMFSVSVADFMAMKPDYINSNLGGTDAQKTAVMALWKNLNQISTGQLPIDARVLGESSVIQGAKQMDQELHNPQYCATIPCSYSRYKVPVMIFASVIDKLPATGLLSASQIDDIKAQATNFYYMVDVNGHYVFEEVRFSGVNWMLAKTQL